MSGKNGCVYQIDMSPRALRMAHDMLINEMEMYSRFTARTHENLVRRMSALKKRKIKGESK